MNELTVCRGFDRETLILGLELAGVVLIAAAALLIWMNRE